MKDCFNNSIFESETFETDEKNIYWLLTKAFWQASYPAGKSNF